MLKEQASLEEGRDRRMQRLSGPNSVRAIQVIEVKAKRGLRIKGDPVREITQYWDMNGNFLAERDSDQSLLADQVMWESERLNNIIKNWSQSQQLHHK